MYTHKYRSRSSPLTVAITSTGQTTITTADTTFLMNHDLVQFVDSATGNTEICQVSADPGATTFTVTRGYCGTSALSSVTNGSTMFLLGNSRTGQEVNQTGLSSVGIPRTQYCQTFQFPVQVGGSAQTVSDEVLPGGVQSPMELMKTMQLQALVDDIENIGYYGVASAPSSNSATNTYTSNGLKSILQTNNTVSPTNASAYGPTDLIRDTLQTARTNGGEPDVLFVSTNFMSGFATWGQAVQRIPAGETDFGTPINVLEAPFLHGVTIIEAPLLRPFTAFALTSSEVYWRYKRNPFWLPHGTRGDLFEGDWIAECAIEVANESHHSWLEGVTAFSSN